MGGAEHLVKSNKRVVEGRGGGAEISVGQRGGGGVGNLDKIKRKDLFVNEIQFHH